MNLPTERQKCNDHAPVWATVISAEEQSARFQRLPWSRREALFALHDRIEFRLDQHTAFGPTAADSHQLHCWIWAEAKHPADAQALRSSLNRLLDRAVREDIRRHPLQLTAGGQPVVQSFQ